MANLFEKLSLQRHDEDSESSGSDQDAVGEGGNLDREENESIESDNSSRSENNMEDEGSMGEGEVEEETLFEEEEILAVQQEDPGRISEAMKSFTIPRKRSVQKELLEEISLTSREFTHELLPLMSLCYRDPATKNKIKHLKVYMVHNQELVKEFHEKRREMKAEGRADKDLAEQLGFLCMDTFEDAQKVCQAGLTVGNSFLSSLGHPNMGVYVSKYADIIKPGPLISGTKGFLIIFKLIKGKMKSVVENNSWNFTEPTPNFDCHVSKALAEIGSLAPNQAFHAAQYYLYEFGDLDMLKRPRHVLPYAVVQFEVFGGPQAFPLMAATSQTRLPQRPSYPSASAPRPPGVSHVGPAYPSYPTIQMGEARRPLMDLTEEGYGLWTGQLVNKENPLCEIELRSPTCGLLPIQMEEQICISGRIPFHKLQKTLPRPIFTKLPKLSPHREVNVDDRYFIYCEVKAVVDVENKLVSLLNFMEKRKEACIAVLPDGVQLLLFPSCQMAQDLGIIDPSSPMMLHGLFVSSAPMLAVLRDCSLRKNIKAPVDSSGLYASPTPSTPSSSVGEAESPKTPKVDTTELRSAMMQVFELQKMQAEGNMSVQDSILNLERQNQLLRTLQAKVEVHSKTLAEAQQKKVLQETDAFDNTDFSVPKFPIVSRQHLEQCFAQQHSFIHRWQLELQRRQHQPTNVDPRLVQVPAFPLQQHSGQVPSRMAPMPSMYPHQMHPLRPHAPHPLTRNIPLGTPSQSSPVPGAPGSTSLLHGPPAYPVSSYVSSTPTPSGSTPPQPGPISSPGGASPFPQQPLSGQQGAASPLLGKFPLSSLPPNQKANDPRLRKHLEAMQTKVPVVARSGSLPSAVGSTATTTVSSPLISSPLITVSSPLLTSEKSGASDSPVGSVTPVSTEKVPPTRSHSQPEQPVAAAKAILPTKEPIQTPKVQEAPVADKAKEEADKPKVPETEPAENQKPATKASGIAKGKDAALQPKAGVVSNIPIEEKEEMKAFLDTVFEETPAESRITSASEMKNFLDTVVIGKPQKKKPKEKEKEKVVVKKLAEKRKERPLKEMFPEKKRIRMPEEDIIKRCMLPSISNFTIPRKKPAQQDKPSVVEYNHGASSTTIDYQHGSSSGPKISPVSKVVDYGHGKDITEQSLEEEEDSDIRTQAIVVDYGHQPPATSLVDSEKLTASEVISARSSVSEAEGSAVMGHQQHPTVSTGEKTAKDADLAQSMAVASKDVLEQTQLDSKSEKEKPSEVEGEVQDDVLEEEEEEKGLTEEFLFCRDVSYGSTEGSLTVTVRAEDDIDEDITDYDGLSDSEALERSVIRAVFSHYYLGDVDLQENGGDLKFAEHVRNSIHTVHTSSQEVSTADRHVVENAEAEQDKDTEKTGETTAESTSSRDADSKTQGEATARVKPAAREAGKNTSSFNLRGKNYYEPSHDLGELMKDLTSPLYKKSSSRIKTDITVSQLVTSPTKKFENCSESFRHTKDTKDCEELDHTTIHADKESARKHSENKDVQQMLRLLDDDINSHQREEGQQAYQAEQDLYKAYDKEQEEQKIVIPGLGGDDDVASTGHSWLRAAGMEIHCGSDKFEEDLTPILSTTQGAQRSGLLRSTASAMLDPRLNRKLCKQKQGRSSRSTKSRQREPCDLPLPRFAEDVMHWLKNDQIADRFGSHTDGRAAETSKTEGEVVTNADSAHRQKDIAPLFKVEKSTGSRKESPRISLSEVNEKVARWLEKFGSGQQPIETVDVQEKVIPSSDVPPVEVKSASLAQVSESADVSEMAVKVPEVDALKKQLLEQQQLTTPEQTVPLLPEIHPEDVATDAEKPVAEPKPISEEQKVVSEGISHSESPQLLETPETDLPLRVKLEPIRVEYRSGVVKRSLSSSPVTASSPVQTTIPTPLSPIDAPGLTPLSPATTAPPQLVSPTTSLFHQTSSSTPQQKHSSMSKNQSPSVKPLQPPGLVIPTLSLTRLKQEPLKGLEQPIVAKTSEASATTSTAPAEPSLPAVKHQVEQHTVGPIVVNVAVSADKAKEGEKEPESITVASEKATMSELAEEKVTEAADTPKFVPLSSENVGMKVSMDRKEEKKEEPTVVASQNKPLPKQAAVVKSPAEVIATAAASKPVKPVAARKPTIAELVVTRLMNQKSMGGRKAGKKLLKKGSRASSPVFETQGKVLKKPGTITIANLKKSPVAGSKAALAKAAGKVKSPGQKLSKVQSSPQKNTKDIISDAYHNFEKDVAKTLDEKGLTAMAVKVSEDSQGTKDPSQARRCSRLTRFSKFYLSCKHVPKYPNDVKEVLIDADYAIRRTERQVTKQIQMERERERNREHLRGASRERTHSHTKKETRDRTKEREQETVAPISTAVCETDYQQEKQGEANAYEKQNSTEASLHFALKDLQQNASALLKDNNYNTPLSNAFNLSFTRGKHLKLSHSYTGNVDSKMATRIDDIVMDSLVPLPLPERYASHIPSSNQESTAAIELQPTTSIAQEADQVDTSQETTIPCMMHSKAPAPGSAFIERKVETPGNVPDLVNGPETPVPPTFVKPVMTKPKPIVINIKTKTSLDPALPQWTKVSGVEAKPQTSQVVYGMSSRKPTEAHQFGYSTHVQSDPPPPGVDQPVGSIPVAWDPTKFLNTMSPQAQGNSSQHDVTGSWAVPGWGMEQCPPWYSQSQLPYYFTPSVPQPPISSPEPPPPGVDDGGDSPLLDERRYDVNSSSTNIDRIIDEVDRDITKVFDSSVENAEKVQICQDVRKVEFRDRPDMDTTTSRESSGPCSNVEALVNELIAAGRSAADSTSSNKDDNKHTEYLYGEYGTPIKATQKVSDSGESDQKHSVGDQWGSFPYKGEFSLHVDHDATDEIVVDLLKDFFGQISDTMESYNLSQAASSSQPDLPRSNLKEQGSHLPALSNHAVAMVRGNKRHAETELPGERLMKWQRYHSDEDDSSEEVFNDEMEDEEADHFGSHLNQLSKHCSKESHSKVDSVTKGSYLATKRSLVYLAGSSPRKGASDNMSTLNQTEEGHLGGSVRFMNLSAEAKERILQARARTTRIVHTLMNRYSNQINDVAEEDHETFKKLSKRQKKNLRKLKQRGSKSEKADLPSEVSYASPITSDSDTELILAQSPDRVPSPPPPATPADQQQETPPSSSVQNWFYVYNPHSDTALQEVKDFLVSAGGTELDPFNLSLVADIPGVDVWVVIRNSDTPDVAHIPNLYELKRMPMVKFVGLDSIDDLRNQTYCHIFTRGAIVVPDEKVLIKATTGELQALCQFMEEQTFDKDEPWTMKLHYSTRLSLEKMKNDITLNYGQREDTWKMLCFLDEYIRKGLIEYLPLLHGCREGDKTAIEMLPCVAKIQLENLETCRHIVMLTDLDQSSEQAGIFWKAGIGVTSLQEFLSVFTGWKGEPKDKGKDTEDESSITTTQQPDNTEQPEVFGRTGNLIEISPVPALDEKEQEEKKEGEEIQGKPIPSLGYATNHRSLVSYITEFSEERADQPVMSAQADFRETTVHQGYLDRPDDMSSQLQASPHVSPGAKVAPSPGQPSHSQSTEQGQELTHPQAHVSPVPQEVPHTQPPQPHSHQFTSPQQPLHPSYPSEPQQNPQTPHPSYPPASTATQAPYSQSSSFPQQSPVSPTTQSPSYLLPTPYPPRSVPYSPAYHYPQQPTSPMVSQTSPQAQQSPHAQSFSPYPAYYSPQPQAPSPQGSTTPTQPVYSPHFQFPASYSDIHVSPQMHEYYMGPPPPGMGPPHQAVMAPPPRGPLLHSPPPYGGPLPTQGGGAESDPSLSPAVENETKTVEKKPQPGSTSPRARIQRSKAAAGKRPVRPPPKKVQPPTPTPT